jgi:hypothetical protein
MKRFRYLLIIIFILFLIACQDQDETILYDITTDDYFIDVTMDQRNISDFDDIIQVDVTLISRHEKSVMLADNIGDPKDHIIQARLVIEREEDPHNPYQLYHQVPYIHPSHNPLWLTLEEDEVISNTFNFTRINTTHEGSLIGPSGTYTLEIALYHGGDLLDLEWLPTTYHVEVGRKTTPDEVVQINEGTFEIDVYAPLENNDYIAILDLKFSSSVNKSLVLPNTYIEGEAAIIQVRLINLSESIILNDQFPDIIIPAEYHIELSYLSSIEKVYLIYGQQQSLTQNDAPAGIYTLQVAFYDGSEGITWISTDITIELS